MCFEATVDLRSKFQPVRHQGKRGSCLPMSVSAVHEFELDHNDILSPEALYYGAAVRMKNWKPYFGILPEAMSNTLSEEGQPSEEAWPYQENEFESLDHWSIPPELGDIWKSNFEWFAPEWDGVVELIKDEIPIVAILNITDSFRTPNRKGVFTEKMGEATIGCHAIVIAGYGEKEGNNEDAFLIRNSWGNQWGDEGYAWLPRSMFDSMAVVFGIIP